MNKIIIWLVIIAVILLIYSSSKIIKYETEIYSNPGKCPVCQTELMKGYLGSYFIARKIYYCPNCD